jgi:tetratricopeptide (TPR) repeat protein
MGAIRGILADYRFKSVWHALIFVRALMWFGCASSFHRAGGDIMGMRIVLAVGSVAGVLAFGGIAEAQTQQQIASCEGKIDPPDVRVAACTVMINSKKYTGHDQSINFNNRCSSYYDNGEYDLAIQDCDRAIKLDSKYAKPYYNRGLSWYSKRDYDKAIKDADEAIKRDPSYARAYGARANAYSDKGDHDRAVRDYNESLRLDPKQPIALANRCDELAILHQFPAARADCDDSLRIRPNHPNTLKHRAMVHLALGNLDDSLADYANVLQQKPKDAGALYGRGMTKLKKGDVAGGNQDMASAKAIREDIADTMETYGLKAVAVSQSQSASAPATDCASAETHWKSAEEIKTLAVYQDHLARFPNCAFAALAAARIEALKK